jgi:hypothetical protein
LSLSDVRKALAGDASRLGPERAQDADRGVRRAGVIQLGGFDTPA